uniref:hypothetical protein n=1 Tax=Flavobacterium sp. TaxID=239 RepID=UPI004049E41D
MKKSNFMTKSNSLNLQIVSFDYKFKPKDFNTFSIYNPYSKLNDLYYYSNNSIYFSKTIQQNPYQFMRKDSFNPNGVSDFGGGLIIGTINTIFNSILQ